MTNTITRELSTNILTLWITVDFDIVFEFFMLNHFNMNQETDLFFFVFKRCFLFYIFYNYAIKQKKMLYIATISGFLIDFFDLNPSKELMDNFLEALKKHSFKYLKDKYTFIDHDVPFEKQLDNFIYLKDKNVITQKEYEVLKKKLKNMALDVKGFRN